MKERKYALSVKNISSKYTNSDTLLEHFYNQLESGKIQIDKHSRNPSPTACLNWDITYKIYDCLYEDEPLTPVEIVSLIDHEKIVYEKEVIVNHTLERMSEIGITIPINHENITSADIPIRGHSISPILYEVKKWTLTETIKM